MRNTDAPQSRGWRERRAERKAAENEAELRGLLGESYDLMYLPNGDANEEGRARLRTWAETAEAEEKRETDEYWADYHALSTREQIRRDGLSWWMTNTNWGVVSGLVLGLAAITLLVAVA